MTKNVTVAIPATVHRKARIWAARHNTSLSAIVTYFLGNIDAFIQAREQQQAENPPNPDVNQPPAM
jgi:hypothetical protein